MISGPRLAGPPGEGRRSHSRAADFETRPSAGLAAARARGRHGGRPSVLSGHKLQVAREMYASGQYTVAVIAMTVGGSRASIYRHLDTSSR